MTAVDDRPADTPAKTPRRPNPLLALARNSWRQLTSMRTALVLLFLLAVAAIPGSVLPQRGVNPEDVRDFFTEHPDLAPWLDRIGAFEAFSSVWFSAIYLLLFTSLIGCITPGWPITSGPCGPGPRPYRSGLVGCRSTPWCPPPRVGWPRSPRPCGVGGGGWWSGATRSPPRRATSRRPAT